jgi:hypothetical protein
MAYIEPRGQSHVRTCLHISSVAIVSVRSFVGTFGSSFLSSILTHFACDSEGITNVRYKTRADALWHAAREPDPATAMPVPGEAAAASDAEEESDDENSDEDHDEDRK